MGIAAESSSTAFDQISDGVVVIGTTPPGEQGRKQLMGAADADLIVPTALGNQQFGAQHTRGLNRLQQKLRVQHGSPTPGCAIRVRACSGRSRSAAASLRRSQLQASINLSGCNRV